MSRVSRSSRIVDRACSGLAPLSDVPSGTRTAGGGVGHHTRLIHLGDHDVTAAVLSQDFGTAVAVVVAGAHDVPARPEVGDATAADHAGAVRLPDSDFPIIVLP